MIGALDRGCRSLARPPAGGQSPPSFVPFPSADGAAGSGGSLSYGGSHKQAGRLIRMTQALATRPGRVSPAVEPAAKATFRYPAK